MMKTQTHARVKGPSKVNTQQVVFELKNKVNLALNKLADRDTCQMGVDELEKTAERLTPDKISPFLSCILDTDSEQKSAVRKECIRLMGTIARLHEGFVGPYLAKMVTSIVKRLKDPDSVVRDACVETMGVLASKLSDCERDSNGVFVVLVKPLFEALGEQYKQVQSGAALCLASIIDNIHDPPSSILQRMLTRTIKLLKNPQFMAKPAVIELNRSIIQSILAATMASIQEALKDTDWTTRKAASVALGEIASSGASFLESFKASCIRSLESCRFDKVKPVRETVIHALKYWRSLPGPDTSEPSEAGSSIKDDYIDLTRNGDSGWKDVTRKKAVMNSAVRRKALSVRKTSQNYMENPQHSKEDDWHIEIAVPKTHHFSLADYHDEESEGSSVSKTLERMTSVTSTHDIGYEFVPMDDKQECSSVSTLLADKFQTKIVTVSPDHLLGGSSQMPMGRNQRFATEKITDEEEELFSTKLQDCRSLDSTVTESNAPNGCCSQVANEMVCIRKRLMQIENKQSNLVDLLQVFSSRIMASLSMLQSQVLSLEHVVEGIAQGLVHAGKYSDLGNPRLMKQSQGVSPRLSTSTPRPSLDTSNRQPTRFVKCSDIWEEKALGSRTNLSSCAKQSKEVWTNHALKISRNPMEKDVQKSSGQGTQIMGHARKNEVNLSSASVSFTSANSRQSRSGSKNGLRQNVKGFLCEGDLDSVYREALSSGNELVLIELLDRTGPVIESLSHKTICDILCTLTSFILEQRFMNSVIPWLQQVIELSTTHGPNHLILPPNVRRELLSGIQEAMNMEFSNPAARRTITQLAMKLHRVSGKRS